MGWAGVGQGTAGHSRPQQASPRPALPLQRRLFPQAVHAAILRHRFLIVRAKELRCGPEQSRRFYREHAGTSGAQGLLERDADSGRCPWAGADSVRVSLQGVSSTSGWWSSWPGTCCGCAGKPRVAGDPCVEGLAGMCGGGRLWPREQECCPNVTAAVPGGWHPRRWWRSSFGVGHQYKRRGLGAVAGSCPSPWPGRAGQGPAWQPMAAVLCRFVRTNNLFVISSS